MLATTAGPRRIVIKNKRSRPQFDSRQYLHEVWQKLDRALDLVFSDVAASFSFQQLYKSVEYVCRQDMGKDLRVLLRKKCEAIVRGLADDIISKDYPDDPALLTAVMRCWTRWNEHMVSTTDFRNHDNCMSSL